MSGVFGWIKRLFGGETLEVRRFTPKSAAPHTLPPDEMTGSTLADVPRTVLGRDLVPPGKASYSADPVAASLSEATAYAEAKDWDKAIAVLQVARAQMAVSPFTYPVETWCKLPLYLQRAGRFEESMQAFDSLLDDLPLRVRRDTALDDPNVSTPAQKRSQYKQLLKNDAEGIRNKKALAEKRQAKALSPTTQRAAANPSQPRSTPANATPGVPAVRNPGPSTQPWPEVILQGRAVLERCIAVGDWDTARAALQKLAYGMADAPPEQKEAFTQIASSYAARDPLVQQVMAVLLPEVIRQPGIKQTATYAQFPQVDPEWLRYVLYYAEVLGQVQRRKSGNSYTLWPIGAPAPHEQHAPPKPKGRRTAAADRKRIRDSTAS